jgi:subtilisin-like proprotein convertase family protein
MNFRSTLIATTLAAGLLSARAQITADYAFDTFNGDATLVIPDGNATGISDSRTITGSNIPEIGSMTVDLKIDGDFNGDLYVYLRRVANDASDALAVLLNRPGRTLSMTRGYADSGLNITLDDSAADIHTYRLVLAPASGTPLTGTWSPDARTADPGTVLDTNPRSAFLSIFNGAGADGTWTLFAADLQPGGASQIDAWGLHFTAVPEPSTIGLVSGCALLGLAACRRLRRANKNGESS